MAADALACIIELWCTREEAQELLQGQYWELEQLASWVLSKTNDVFEPEMNCHD